MLGSNLKKPMINMVFLSKSMLRVLSAPRVGGLFLTEQYGLSIFCFLMSQNIWQPFRALPQQSPRLLLSSEHQQQKNTPRRSAFLLGAPLGFQSSNFLYGQSRVCANLTPAASQKETWPLVNNQCYPCPRKNSENEYLHAKKDWFFTCSTTSERF